MNEASKNGCVWGSAMIVIPIGLILLLILIIANIGEIASVVWTWIVIILCVTGAWTILQYIAKQKKDKDNGSKDLH